jgi:ATP-binding cassette subfamily C protein LapB
MNPLVSSIKLIATLQRVSLNISELEQIVSAKYDETSTPLKNLQIISKELSIKQPVRVKQITDPSILPLLIFDGTNWGVLKSVNAKGEYVTQFEDEITTSDISSYQLFTINFTKELYLGKSKTFNLVKTEILKHKKLLIDGLVAGIFINIVAIVSVFYSMQIYDRVVPTGAKQTLLVLTIGVVIVIILEFFAKLIRSNLSEKLVEAIDKKLSHYVYERFTRIRLDKLPQSVGTMSGQMRGYESIRGFLATITSYLVVDMPFVLFYVFLIAFIAGYLAFIPLLFLSLALIVGLYFYKKIMHLANNINEAVNLKTGLLVESIEGAETIKSGQGGWRLLSRWRDVSNDARDYELEMKKVSDNSSYTTAMFQQLSFISIVASGSLLISSGDLTMGGLIACSILSGRILAPIAQIPLHLVNYANTRTAVKSLDSMLDLDIDYGYEEQPIILENIKGNFDIKEETKITYGEKLGLVLSRLTIKSGEKIAVIGNIGSGKTSLLRLLSGMYNPTEGKILLDDINLSKISKPNLSENIGYLQQDGRLFKGTLRENLTLGLSAITDEEIINISKQTGLLDRVINTTDKGLDFEISEGGLGLSGGQKQLLNLTRIFLKNPKIWLLDEPTASLDTQLELVVINLLKDKLCLIDTLVLITHKMQMLELVDRVIVINNNQVIMDGNKDDVLQRLKNGKK